MSTEYYVTLQGDQSTRRLLGTRISLGKGKGLGFVWAIHPHEFFTYLSVWVTDELGESWPLEGFAYAILKNIAEFDYSQIGG